MGSESSRKILIVEDEAYIRLLIEQTLEELEEQGVEILKADNGEDALRLIQEEKTATGIPGCDDPQDQRFRGLPDRQARAPDEGYHDRDPDRQGPGIRLSDRAKRLAPIST